MIIGREARKLVERYGMEMVVPRELCRGHKPPRGYVTVLESFLKFGAISVEPILQGCPLFLRADSVLGDTQRMGSHDWALRVVHGVKDDPPPPHS